MICAKKSASSTGTSSSEFGLVQRYKKKVYKGLRGDIKLALRKGLYRSGVILRLVQQPPLEEAVHVSRLADLL